MPRTRRPATAGALALALAGVLALGAGPAAAAQAAPARLPAGVTLADGAPAAPTGITAASWLVADLDTGEVLAARDPHAKRPPASTLKVLTALALLPVVPSGTLVRPTQEQVDIEGSKVGLVPGVAYPAEELYSALLMVSGNDAANALAGAAGGTPVAARLMNEQAARLGAVDTRATNPHGLHAEGQVSTAYDLALIARAALAVPEIAEWVVTQRSTVSAGPGKPRFEVFNKNKLLGSYEGALGVKTGYTTASLATFIGAAERDGRRLVVVMLRSQPRFWAEATALLDWGFAAARAGAEPVGHLPPPPEPEQPEETEDVEPAAAAAGADGGFRLPDVRALPARQLGGTALVLAAVVAVRPARRRVGATA
ncbi:MAG TPA: serine hydrolase [Mycobacteriales bacterium]|nr:serine hydrolase [Mycobacteriales bacterium]